MHVEERPGHAQPAGQLTDVHAPVRERADDAQPQRVPDGGEHDEQLLGSQQYILMYFTCQSELTYEDSARQAEDGERVPGRMATENRRRLLGQTTIWRSHGNQVTNVSCRWPSQDISWLHPMAATEALWLRDRTFAWGTPSATPMPRSCVSTTATEGSRWTN